MSLRLLQKATDVCPSAALVVVVLGQGQREGEGTADEFAAVPSAAADSCGEWTAASVGQGCGEIKHLGSRSFGGHVRRSGCDVTRSQLQQAPRKACKAMQSLPRDRFKTYKNGFGMGKWSAAQTHFLFVQGPPSSALENLWDAAPMVDQSGEDSLLVSWSIETTWVSKLFKAFQCFSILLKHFFEISKCVRRFGQLHPIQSGRSKRREVRCSVKFQGASQAKLKAGTKQHLSYLCYFSITSSL